MVPDRAFVDELCRFDPNLLVVWQPKAERWQIRHWLERPRFFRRYFIPRDTWKRKSFLIRTVCRRDDEFHDVGYLPLDDRVLYALKLSRKLSLHPEKTAKAVQDSNDKVEAEWHAANRDIAREVATSIYRHYREPSVDLGGRSPY